MLSELTTEEIDFMLVNQYVGRIGCAAEGRILIEPVTYYYDGHSIYGLTREGTKTQLLRKNPSVCFEIDDVGDFSSWRSVVIEGVFDELQGDDRDNAIYLLAHRQIPVFADERMGYTGERASVERKVVYPVVYRIRIQRKTGRRFTHEPDCQSTLYS